MKNYFSDNELKCKCCGKLIMDQDFRDKLNATRELAGFEFIVLSGYRCWTHNFEVGSTSTNHTTGKGCDIRCMDSWVRWKMVNAAIIAGMRGIGIAKNFIHCDTNRTTPAFWTY